jgi:hypothetical protein
MTNGMIFVNFPYLYSNIPSSSAYDVRVYILQLILYAEACSTYDQFLILGRLLTNKVMPQGFLQSRLQTVLRTVYGRHNDQVCTYNIPLGQMLSDMFYTNRYYVDYGPYHLPDLEIGLTAGVTGRSVADPGISERGGAVEGRGSGGCLEAPSGSRAKPWWGSAPGS